MAFDPNEYVGSPVDPNVEQQATPTTDASASQATGGFDPDAYLAQTPAHPTETHTEKTAGETAKDLAVGVPVTAAKWASENPKTAAVMTELGLAALPQSVASKVPVLNQASQLAKLPFHFGNGVLENWQVKNINDLSESIRKAERFGQDTTAMKEQLNRLISKLPAGPAAQQTAQAAQQAAQGQQAFGQMAQHLQTPAPVAPQAPVGGAPVAPGAVPPASPQAAPTAENFLSRMTQMAKQYAPQVAETASDVAGRVGRVIAPVARIAGSAPALGAQLMLHSGGLNTNEDEELRLMHQKQDIERQRLANQHAQEWNKYKDAKIKALGSI